MKSSRSSSVEQLQQALEHHQAGRLEQAGKLYRDILVREPENPDALHLLGVIAHQLGQHEHAVELIDRAIRAQPSTPAYYNNLGEALTALTRLDQAIAAYQQAGDLAPDYAETHNNLGIALQMAKREEEAIAAFRRAIQAKPDFAEAHYNLGNALLDTGRPEEAVRAYRAALRLLPEYAQAYNNLGIALVAQLRVDQALQTFDQALDLIPDFAEAHANKGMALLLNGQFAKGWPEHSWRFGCAEQQERSAQSRFSEPEWGGSDFAGKTLLVHAEQGFGDTIQFVRYLPAVKAKGGQVLLACQPELHRLFANLAGVDALLADARDLPVDVGFDTHVSLLELPRLFGTELKSIPQQVPYLSVDVDRVAAWRSRVALGRFNVGLCWAGRPTHPNDRNRSMTLAAFAPLAGVPGIAFYSLQKGAAAEQLRQPPAGMELIDYSGDLHDFTDTGALVMNLDLVISVDTAPVHVAGALGREVWTLLPFAPDWRWLRDREDSPWYPTMRLFRQPRIGDWKAVMDQVALALQAFVRKRSDTRR
jgi:tetratricopeptide (TPR) repeat protein